MIPNNNFSVLPWYRSKADQNAQRWWIYGRVYPLFTPAGFMPTWQFMIPSQDYGGFLSLALFNANTDAQILSIPRVDFGQYGILQKTIGDYVVLYYSAILPILNSQDNGRYYLRLNHDGDYYYSDVFTVVNDIQPYLKLEWWDDQDFVMDAGAIAYDGTFKNALYLDSDIAKPEYVFEEEGETRDGYFYPVKMISEKRYRFNFLAPEYLLDVLRFVRMADHIQITKNGQVYSLDTFLITPEWEANGDVAVVAAEFETATVAKKIGLGYVRALRGDFNDDFNDDFNNQ